MKDTRDFYDATAHEWADKWYADETMLPLLQSFIALLPEKPHVLDAGCGAGYVSMRLSKLGATVMGIDFSEESILIAKEKNPSCTFKVMDCRKVDYALGQFDGIVAIALLVHMRDEELALVLNGFRKVTHENGYILVAFVYGEGLSEKRSYVDINGEKYNRAFYLHQPSRIVEAAIEAGFEYFDEWYLPEAIGQWKYFVFKAR